jgi:hypothetical protein
MRKLFVLLTALVVVCGLVLSGDVTFASPKHVPPVNVAFLQEVYNSYNDTYFGGSLPKDTAILYAPYPEEPLDVALTSCSIDPQTMKPTACTIYIAPYTNKARSVATGSMIHEMCHISTYQKGITSEAEGHGKVWTRCMMGVAQAGGFDGVW